MEQLKEVKIVFVDYNADSFALANAKISNVNLYKKTNKLELFLQSEELIPLSEIEKFEDYIKKRFNIKEVSLKIEVAEEIQGEKIVDDWKNILLYLSKKVPIIKAFLKESRVEIIDSNLNIYLCFKGKTLLEKQGINTYIANFIKDIYGKGCKINFIEENINQTELQFNKANEDIIKEFAINSAKAVANRSNEDIVVGETGEQKKSWNGRFAELE